MCARSALGKAFGRHLRPLNGTTIGSGPWGDSMSEPAKVDNVEVMCSDGQSNTDSQPEVQSHGPGTGL